MTVSLGDVAVWQPGRTELEIKGRRSSLKDTTGCEGTFVLADLILSQEWDVSSSHTCWKVS